MKARCNFCHRVQNPGKVFNTHNMEEYQAKIYQQVFIFRRMPKGKTELTEAERQALLSWVKLK
ncbi:c-type cytochrome [Fulvivirga kasyanovii]|uniref:c-type cytochrome n=1 Tax=Fulvivirga kasyanovii TaxID=396812 RepID=UPI003CCD0902